MPLICIHTLSTNTLPEIIVNRTFNRLPQELRTNYLNQQKTGNEVAVGLDLKLGYYLLKYTATDTAELLWWENQTIQVKAA